MLRYILKNPVIKILVFVDDNYTDEDKLKIIKIIEEFHNSPLS